MLKFFGFRTFNDRLAIVTLVLMVALWGTFIAFIDRMSDRAVMVVASPLVGASITWISTVLQFYFRKGPPEPPQPPIVVGGPTIGPMP